MIILSLVERLSVGLFPNNLARDSFYLFFSYYYSYYLLFCSLSDAVRNWEIFSQTNYDENLIQMCLTRWSGNPTRKHCEPMKYSAEKNIKKIKNIYYSKPWYMYFTFIKTEIVCALVYSEGTAVVVVTVILGRHGVMASASYRFSQYS